MVIRNCNRTPCVAIAMRGEEFPCNRPMNQLEEMEEEEDEQCMPAIWLQMMAMYAVQSMQEEESSGHDLQPGRKKSRLRDRRSGDNIDRTISAKYEQGPRRPLYASGRPVPCPLFLPHQFPAPFFWSAMLVAIPAPAVRRFSPGKNVHYLRPEEKTRTVPWTAAPETAAVSVGRGALGVETRRSVVLSAFSTSSPPKS